MTDLTFAQKLILAQQQIGKVARDAANPRFGSRYATLDTLLEAVKPALHAQGLLLTQLINATPTGDLVVTRITDGADEVLAATPICADRSMPQAFGSAITYARRYALAALLAISTDDDDDGNSAQPLAAPARASVPPTVAAQPAAATPAPSGSAPNGEEPNLDRLRAIECHFGKNRGTKLGDLTLRSLSWYANDWQPRFDERTGRLSVPDEELKLAARQLLETTLHPGQATYVPEDITPAVIDDEADGIAF
jgi:hypothetical protein